MATAIPKGVLGTQALLDLIAARSLTTRPSSHFTAGVPEVLAGDANYNTRVLVAPTAPAKLSGQMYFRYNRVTLDKIQMTANQFDIGTATSVSALLPTLNAASGMSLTMDDLVEATIPATATSFTLTAASTSRLFIPGSTFKVGLFAPPFLWIDPSAQAANDTVFTDKSTVLSSISNVGCRVADTGPKSGMKSIYFPNDKVNYLRISNAKLPNELTGDFTIEFWFLAETRTVSACFTGHWAQISGQGGFILQSLANGGRELYWGPSSENTPLATAATAGSTFTWEHHAVTRKGSTFTIWRNGVAVASASSGTTRAVISSDWGIGAYNGRTAGTFPQMSAAKLNGWMADYKASNYCRYTKTFVPE